MKGKFESVDNIYIYINIYHIYIYTYMLIELICRYIKYIYNVIC